MKISKSLSIKRSKLFLHCIESQGGAGQKSVITYDIERNAILALYIILYFLLCYVDRFINF